MLPSTFVPTCSECSTAYTTPGCVSVRGDSTMAVCRECHHKMSESPTRHNRVPINSRGQGFRIQEVKFLMVSAAAVRATQGPILRKVNMQPGHTPLDADNLTISHTQVKENLGIVAGQELPRRGKCQHYAKSYRWFRCVVSLVVHDVFPLV